MVTKSRLSANDMLLSTFHQASQAWAGKVDREIMECDIPEVFLEAFNDN